jgi:coenzyme F420-dependent glucose-6-phosphate dehydrogenase
MVKFGWKAGAEQYPPRQLLEYATLADELGFDLIDVSDHFHPWCEAGQASFVWTWLGAAAARTSRIQLGPGLTCPILRYHPAVVAQAAATLACLAPGRTYLAVGTGEALNEYSSVAAWPGYTERQERLAEAIELIRILWTGEETTFRGRFYQTRKARIYTLPDTPIPVYISSLAPGSSAAFAGKYGDGLLTVGGQPAEVYREMLQRFENGAREAGKDPSQMPRLVEIGVEFTDDFATAVEVRKRYWAATFLPALYNQKIYTPRMAELNGALVGNDTVRERVCISTDQEEHLKFIQRYVDLGFDHLIFHAAGPDQRTFLEAYSREVLPRARTAPVLIGGGMDGKRTS